MTKLKTLFELSSTIILLQWHFRVFDMRGEHVGEEQFSVALPSVLSLHFPQAELTEDKKPKKSPKVKAKKGWKRLEVDTATDDVVEDVAEHDPTKTYLSVHWSGDSDMEDTRIWMHTSITDKRVNGGLKTTGDLQVFNAFELVRFTIG